MAEPNDNGLKKKIGDHDAVIAECHEIEEKLAGLRAEYEQYFLGVERHPPQAHHNELKRRLQALKGTFVRSTVVKFRLQGLQQKFVTYERLWARTIQEIENGTYHRDVFKAKMRSKSAEAKRVEPTPAEPKPAPAEAAPKVPP